MTKKQRSSKQSGKDNHPFRFQSLHERLNNININVVHRIRYHEQIDHLARSSHFHQSLEQVVYNRDRIFEIVREAFHERNPLILETLLDLGVQLARDLQGDIYLDYKQSLFEDIAQLLMHSKQNKMKPTRNYSNKYFDV